MNVIVVAYNDTDSSARALDRAAELAGFYDAKLVVTSVVPVLVGSERPPANGPELEHAQAKLRELGLEAELVEAVGEISEAIVEVAESRGADLIVRRYAGAEPGRATSRPLGERGRAADGALRRPHRPLSASETGAELEASQNSPTVLPRASTSMSNAAGAFPSPGMVIMSPQSATIHPAPV